MAQSVTLGSLPIQDKVKDALHISVISGLAGEALKPGDRIVFRDGKWYKAKPDYSGIAIVDPYLRHTIKKDTLFWACMNPNYATGVRHVWEHEDFPDEVMKESSKEDSEKWLRDFLETVDCPGYDIVMAAIRGENLSYDSEYYNSGYEISGEYIYFAGRDAHAEIPAVFWDHVDNVLGYKYPLRPKYFTCSC